MPLAASTVRFELARLGDRAGLVGALLLIQEELGLSQQERVGASG